MDKQYSTLFEPFKIRNLEIKNRFFMAPMGIPVIDENGAYTNGAVEYYVTRAKGGIGLIITGANWVENKAKNHAKLIFPSPTTDPEAYKNTGIEMTDRIHAYGTKIFVQLAVGCGCSAVPHWMDGKGVAEPSATANFWNPGKSSRELAPEEVVEIVTGFAESAKIVKASGFDGVEVHAGYLLDCFAIERFNQRTDKYGGDLKDRLRFATEILLAIKEACGKDFPVILRFSMKSYIKASDQSAVQGEVFEELGRNIKESMEVAKILEAAGYDGFDVDAGTSDSNYWAYPPMYFGKGLYLPLSEELKKVVKVPVMVAGRMDDPDMAAEALAGGKLDAVGLGRPVLADPDYPVKLKNGLIKDIRPCISCNDGCIGRKIAGGRGSCTVNPECNRELIVSIEPGKGSKTVVVAGGGLAGMEAARVSALRGYQITLFEATDRLGGMLKYSTPEFKKDDRALIAWYENQLNKLNVVVKFNTKATKEKIDEIKPDIIYTAEGSKARELEFPGMGSEKITNAIDVLTGKTYVRLRCTVIGGGIAGCEVALHLASHRHKMTIVEESSDILKAGVPLAPPNEQLLRDLLAFYHVEIVTNARLKEVTETDAVIMADGQERSIPVHHVIIAVGYESTDSLYNELKRYYPQVYNIGDSQKVRNIRAAIWDSYEVARSI
ncbi:MAG: FAD-dependent oxidoreductase [Acetobacterium sp.]